MDGLLDALELERRKPLWSAISTLWLDTEVEPHHIEHIARVAIESGYDFEALNRIYLYEVAPVVAGNLWTPAGVWAGFDEDWLHAQAAKRAASANRWWRFWVALGPGRTFLTYATQGEWERVLERVRARGDGNR